MNRWNNYYTAGLVFIVLLIIFFFGFNSFGLFERTEPIAAVNTTEETVNISAIEMVDIYKAQIICLTAENQALRDSIALLLKEKEDCMKEKEDCLEAKSSLKPVVDQLKKLNQKVGNLQTPVSPPAPVSEKEYTFTPAPVPNVTETYSSTTSTSKVASTNESCILNTDLGTVKTIYKDGWTSYIFEEKLKGNITPEFMFKGSGKFFKLEGNWYVYKEYGSPASWTALIDNSRGYDEFLAHKLVKPAMREALGRDYGPVSGQNLKDIGGVEPAVKIGYIIPNQYEGWEFVPKFKN